MKRIAVFFPGLGYHCDKPLLYYSRAFAVAAGFDTIVNLTYTYSKAGLRGNPPGLRAAIDALLEQTEAALQTTDWQMYDEPLFVSKSIGTAVASAYARRHGLNCRSVYYTPIEQTFECEPQPGIAFTGTADPWVETRRIVEGCDRAGIRLTVIEGANHSLETPDPARNLKILLQVMEATRGHIG